MICSSSLAVILRMRIRFVSFFDMISRKPSNWIEINGVIATIATTPNALVRTLSPAFG